MSLGSACFHRRRTRSLSGYGADDRLSGKSCYNRSEAPPADAKKTASARVGALQNPMPPDFTGRVGCSHESTWSKSILVILYTIDFRRGSQDCKEGEEWAGDVHRSL